MENIPIIFSQPEPNKKGTTIEKLRENPWIISTFVLGILVLMLLVLNINENLRPDEIIPINNETKMLTSQEICPQIRAVPSWIRNNEILEGYTEFNDESPSNIIDNLIKNKVYFVWSSTCTVCARQKLLFGNEWQRYIDSGYTIQCG